MKVKARTARLTREADDLVPRGRFDPLSRWLESGGGNGGAILELGKISLVYAEASRRIAQLSTPRDARPFLERWRW